MCLFTHFAAGALAGGATGNVWVGAVAGLASHAVLDVIPHYDHPDWRIELGGGILALLILLLMPFSSAAAVVGGLFGMAPDLENLFQKLGRMKRSSFLFPTHTGLLPHGRELGPRSLVWQVVIFVGCFLALGLIQPGEASAAEPGGKAEMDRPVVRLMSQGQDRSVVRVSFPVVSHPSDWRTLDINDVEWALPMETTGEATDGPPDGPPHVDVSLAVPTRRAVATRVLDVVWWRDPDTAHALDSEVVFGAPAVYRSVPITGAAVPVAAGGGVLREITLEVSHPADGTPRRQLALAGAADEFAARNRVRVPEGILNADLYRALATGGLELARTEASRDKSVQGKAAEFDPFTLTSHWVKIEVMDTGVYRFTGQDLLNYGVATGDVDPAKLRLYRGGGRHLDPDPEVPDTLQFDRAFLNEIPIEVVDGGDGEWNLDDEVRFYGFGSSAWLDRFDANEAYDEYYDHPYSDRAVYWLTWETDSTPTPLPGTPMRVAVTAAPSLAGAPVEFGRSRVHAERQNFSEAGLVEDDWTWDNAVISSLPSQTFNLRKVVPDSAADFTMDVRGKWFRYDRHTFQLSGWVNDDEAGAGSLSFSKAEQSVTRRLRIEGRTTDIGAGINTFKMRNDSGHGVPASFDCFDIYYWALLDISAGGTLEFTHLADQVAAPGTPTDFRVTAPAGEVPRLWDVTDALEPAVFTGEDLGGDVHAFGFVRNQVDRDFFAMGEGDYLQPVSGRRVRPTSLRGSVPDVDYVVVHAPLFAGPAADLAQYRSMELPGVTNPSAIAVSAGDIYDNFSGGQKDPRAIRNYLRRIYVGGGMRLQFACLLGNASRDYRNHKGQDPALDLYDHLPTELRTYFPKVPVPVTADAAYSSDDGFSSFDTPPVGDLDFPDIATGRLPASDLAEAQDLVERTILYASDPEPGGWRNEVVFAADDCVTFASWPLPAGLGEKAHTDHAEGLAGLFLPLALDLEKIYGVAYEFPPSSRIKPEMRSDINEALGNGASIFYYVGHGAEDNLADEQIFQSSDISTLGNGMRRPLFNAFSCDVGVFDNPSHLSMAEKFILEEDGGSIGSICASQVSYATPNFILSQFYYAELFPGRRVDPAVTVAEALMRAKASMSDVDRRRNSQRYNLLGDPGLRLPQPTDDLAFAESSSDTLFSGNLATVRLDGGKALLAPGDSYELLAEESGYDFGFVYAYRDSYPPDYPLSPVVRVPSWDTFPHRGGTVFRGNGVVGAGDLEVPFMVPAQLRYGDRARLRLVTSGLDGEHSAFMELPAVRAPIGTNDDLSGPAIDLAFENESFTVRPGTPLNAVLSDSSGIAILGTTPGNSLLLEFDDSGFMLDVTSSFSYDANSYTAGRLSFPLPGDLALGRHTAALHGSDALGNVGNDTLSFEVAPAGVSGIERITLFPNPTAGPCRLIFELSDPMEVQWEIYTTSGRRLKTVRRSFAQSGPRILEWDGRDDHGDEIANGTYLYVLRGLGGAEEGRDITSTGKLVIMR